MPLWTLLFIYLTFAATVNSDLDYWRCAGGEERILTSEGRPFVWIDHSSTCNQASRLTCTNFGLDFICSTTDCINERVRSQVCTTALCAAKKAQPLVNSTPSNLLKVVTYNIYELDYVYDVSLLNVGPLPIPPFYQYTGQRERTCRIPQEILRNHGIADVLVFQELFMGGCFPDKLNFRDLLTYYGFHFITPTVGTENRDINLPIIENGGVIIASRWPIVHYEDYVFTNSDPTTADAYASKGIMYAHIMKTDDAGTVPYHIFGTHMQAEVGDVRQMVREAQASEILSFIDSLRIPSSEAVIIAGDFNVDLNNFREQTERVLNNMGAVLPKIIGPLRTTWDPLTNELILSNDQLNEQWLDYVVLSSSHLTADVKGSLTAFKPQSPTFRVCINATTGEYVSERSPECEGTLDVMNLSDHFAVVGLFVFPENPKKNLKRKKLCTWRFHKQFDNV